MNKYKRKLGVIGMDAIVNQGYTEGGVFGSRYC